MGKTLEDNLSYIHNLGTEPLQYRNLGQCLEISANKWPERPFIVSNHESVSMTYSQMLEEVCIFLSSTQVFYHIYVPM